MLRLEKPDEGLGHQFQCCMIAFLPLQVTSNTFRRKQFCSYKAVANAQHALLRSEDQRAASMSNTSIIPYLFQLGGLDELHADVILSLAIILSATS